MKYVCLQSSYAAGVFRRRGDVVEVGVNKTPPPFSELVDGEAPAAAVKPMVLADFAPPAFDPLDGPANDFTPRRKPGRPPRQKDAQ